TGCVSVVFIGTRGTDGGLVGELTGFGVRGASIPGSFLTLDSDGGFEAAIGWARSSGGRAWPRRRGSGPLIGRLRTPLTNQVVGECFGLPVSAFSLASSNVWTPRPWNRRSSFTATPAASN